MRGYVLGFEELDRTQVSLAGGKGANLGELSRIEGVRVPPGFCVTTNAYDAITKTAPSMSHLLDHVSRLKPDERVAIRELSAEIRNCSKRSSSPMIWSPPSLARSTDSVCVARTPCDRVRRWKTHRRRPSRDSRTRI